MKPIKIALQRRQHVRRPALRRLRAVAVLGDDDAVGPCRGGGDDGGGGGDYISGGAYTDYLEGGSGADYLLGGGGQDFINGGVEGDVISFDEWHWNTT
mgnify:CR=1 FL=1